MNQNNGNQTDGASPKPAVDPRKMTYAFPVHLVGELEAPAAEGVEPKMAPGAAAGSRAARLLVMRGPNAGAQFLLNKTVTSAGRSPDCDIRLDDATVSRRHVEFRLENGQFEVIDLDSLNQTYVNQDAINSAVLNHGDEIQIGKFRLVFLTQPS